MLPVIYRICNGHEGDNSWAQMYKYGLKLRLWLLTWCLITTLVVQTRAQQNVTLQNGSPELVYLPAFCGVEVLDSVPSDCEGIWTPVFLDSASNGSVSTTNGPSDRFGDILPQVFFIFRGSAAFVKTSDISNATANLTVSSSPSGFFESRVFEPSVDFWAIFDISPSDTTTIALTYLPDPVGEPTRLDIDFVKISVPDASETDSFLPTQTFPTSVYMPFTETVTLSPSQEADRSNNQARGTIIGATVAAVFAFAGLLVAAYIYWRRLRRRRIAEERRLQAQAASQVMAQVPRSAPVNFSDTPDGGAGAAGPSRFEGSMFFTRQPPSPAFSGRASSLALPIWSRWRRRPS